MSSYIDHGIGGPGATANDAVDWQAITHARLAWTYGPERAESIRQGNDHKTLLDLVAWSMLGRRGAA